MDAHSGLIASIRKGTPQDATAFQMALRRVASTGLDIASTYRGLWEGREATEAMLSRLASRMRWGSYQWPSGPGGWTSDDNPDIPAGYTYLAQLVAHDMVQNTSQLPMISDFPGHMQRDYRAQRLVLDTIYGGGPVQSPLPYGVATNGSAERCLLRLGHVRGQEPQPFDKNPHAPLEDQPARDIPRARCPFLSDQPSARVSPDSLLADPRNDQHLIISQLTALFHELHNIIFAKIRALQIAPLPTLVEQLNLPIRAAYVSDAVFARAQDDMAFLQTRKVVARIYRGVIVEDLLKRLLETSVHAYYSDPKRLFPADFFDPHADSKVPVEFSHAVFRFGHVMARFSYKLNNQLNPNPSLKDLLDRSSAKRRDLLPLASNWLVDWSLFFDVGGVKAANSSRRISPFIATGPLATDAIVSIEKDRDGGLFYQDFVRGYEAGVSTVDTLIGKLRASERDRSDLLKDANLREHEIGKWLTQQPGIGFSRDELVSISQNPPLLFFILFEAAYTQGGRRLGILGSTLIADAFFQALDANRSTIEEDPAVSVLLQEIFAGAAAPNTMPALIQFMTANGGLRDVVFTP